MNSLPELFREAVAEHAERPCVLLKEGGEVVSHSYAELGEQLTEAACGLLSAGVAAGERVVILSENRPEWVVADGAILSCGAVTVPLYPTLPAEQVAPLIQRVGARLVLCDDAAQLAKMDAQRAAMPSLERIVLFDAEDVPAGRDEVGSWADLTAAGRARADELGGLLAERGTALGPDSLATIIFTSGTTGIPKGAMLTHGNLCSNVLAAQRRIHLDHEQFVTFLPLSHVFQRMVSYIGLRTGCCSLYNESLRALLGNLRLVRPTALIAVPRFLEMVRGQVLDGVRRKSGLAGTIAGWAMEVAEQVGRAYDQGRSPGGWLKLQQRLAERRVFSAIREQLGMDRLRIIVAGGAALPPELGRWYYGIGLKISQGYGLTETSPVVAVHDPAGKVRFDTIGPPVEGIEVRLADDGELLTRGPHVMAGYYEMPAETAEVIDAEGWFRTGDIAAWTEDGQLKITDRKKNIMVLANGKNVAPAPIENKLLESPLIDQVLLIGDNQNVVTALVVPQYDLLAKALEQAGETAGERADMVASKTAEKLIRQEIAARSGDLAPFEMVRRFTLLPTPFTVEREEMTPTMKLRRKVILEHYAEAVREMAE